MFANNVLAILSATGLRALGRALLSRRAGLKRPTEKTAGAFSLAVADLPKRQIAWWVRLARTGGDSRTAEQEDGATDAIEQSHHDNVDNPHGRITNWRSPANAASPNITEREALQRGRVPQTVRAPAGAERTVGQGQSGVRRVQRQVMQCVGNSVILGTEAPGVTVCRSAVVLAFGFRAARLCLLGVRGRVGKRRRVGPPSSAALVHSGHGLERHDGRGLARRDRKRE